jgi:hypothetical protein
LPLFLLFQNLSSADKAADPQRIITSNWFLQKEIDVSDIAFDVLQLLFYGAADFVLAWAFVFDESQKVPSRFLPVGSRGGATGQATQMIYQSLGILPRLIQQTDIGGKPDVGGTTSCIDNQLPLIGGQFRRWLARGQCLIRAITLRWLWL